MHFLIRSKGSQVKSALFLYVRRDETLDSVVYAIFYFYICSCSYSIEGKGRKILYHCLVLSSLRQRMLRGKDGIMSLAQGIVHWSPPPGALEAPP